MKRMAYNKCNFTRNIDMEIVCILCYDSHLFVYYVMYYIVLLYTKIVKQNLKIVIHSDVKQNLKIVTHFDNEF